LDVLEIIVRLQEKEQRGGYESLAAQERVVLDVAALEAEVNNGGLNQFFFNSAGDRVFATIEALKEIGAPETARIVEDACGLFAGEPSRDRRVRQEQLEQLDDTSFDPVDQRFYAYPEALEELLEAYCGKHEISV
jgi:hypothetical protein